MGLKKYIRRFIIKALPDGIKERMANLLLSSIKAKDTFNAYINLSFSQEGEDLVLYRLIGHKQKGFYVDVGAHHPFRFSNTYKFYLLGWNGVNIDPLPGSMDNFNKERPNDVNLEISILSDSSKTVTYYMFNEPALNTFDQQTAIDRDENTAFSLTNKIEIKPYRLDDVLEKYLQDGQEIDFLSIDVEGMDLDVLRSNNWEKYQPNYIVTESIATDLKHDLNSEVTKFLADKKYGLIAKTANSLIYSHCGK